ncbi:hypothetical protein MAPG_06557 [Magnaporthiopsis poae ATCC 64411]|uniref:Acetate kinase n=1 Tax=Magnaporthiopsis poae (strain ATCC 64411 / 73-15) TaxID=644358 RepID=A0A0C4E2C4_MAGP6|nr:hypothetical protein MAPG_06557 [Magnaporthiopsis poae ATCC 64411]
MASGSSGASYSSSSVRYPPSYVQAQTSPLDSTWTTPTTRSTVSAISSTSSQPPTPLRPLDLGPPGYQATITLFERTADEITVYLGPWDFESAGVDHRRLSWQCSYQGEVLEHYLPGGSPADTIPLTRHAHNRRFEDPGDMELYVSFNEPQRVRYVTADGTPIHDAYIQVKYVFATFENSIRFQSDLRHRELIDFFDIDVVWSDKDERKDRFGAIRGIATGQRMKLWKDMPSLHHSLTFLAGDHRFREYYVSAFEREIRSRDDTRKSLRLEVRGRRASGHSTSSSSRRRSFGLFSRGRSVDDTAGGQASSSHQADIGSSSHGLTIRHLGIQFSRSDDLERFIQRWDQSCAEDSMFNGVMYPLGRFELASAELHAENAVELPAGPYSTLETVSEPGDGEAPLHP